MRTHEWAYALIANSNLVPDWANWEEFGGSRTSGRRCTAR